MKKMQFTLTLPISPDTSRTELLRMLLDVHLSIFDEIPDGNLGGKPRIGRVCETQDHSVQIGQWDIRDAGAFKPDKETALRVLREAKGRVEDDKKTLSANGMPHKVCGHIRTMVIIDEMIAEAEKLPGETS